MSDPEVSIPPSSLLSTHSEPSLTDAADSEWSLLKRFQDVALALSAERDLNALLELIIMKCREAVVADAGSLYLLEEDEHGSRLSFAVAQNASRTLNLRATTLPHDRGSIAGYVALTRTTLNVPDVYALPSDAEYAFNPRMDQVLGYRTVSMLVVPMVNRSGAVVGVLQLINKKRSPTVRLLTPEAAVEQTLPFTRQDEELVPVLANLAAVGIEARRADETRAALQDQLRQARKMEALGRLAGGVAHDFNNILMVVQGRSELLLHHVGDDSPLRRHIDLIKQSADRAASLTRQLLAFSRRRAVQTKALNLNTVVAAMAAMLRPLIGEHIELVVVQAPDLGWVEAAEGQLEQAIMNLTVNARDAMPQGGRLTLETGNAELDPAFARSHRGARPGSYVMLAVTDTGIGMDADTKSHIFEPFFTTKDPGAGTGLGLAMVYGIVKQHQGYVMVESEPGHGARFTTYLPRTDDPGDALPSRPPNIPYVVQGSETVLFVEDEQSVRELIGEMLRATGYSVLEARHGAEALLLAERHPDPIHLLLTDVVMPQMSGPEVARRLTTLRPEMRVLYVSAYAADARIPHGAVLLSKPFTADALARTLREVLDAPSGPGTLEHH